MVPKDYIPVVRVKRQQLSSVGYSYHGLADLISHPVFDGSIKLQDDCQFFHSPLEFESRGRLQNLIHIVLDYESLALKVGWLRRVHGKVRITRIL